MALVYRVKICLSPKSGRYQLASVLLILDEGVDFKVICTNIKS